MNEVRLACGLPFIQDTETEEINVSIGLRVTALVLGTLAVIVGSLILLKVNGFSQFGATAGWTTASLGAFVVLVSTSIKCVKEAHSKEIIKKNIGTKPQESKEIPSVPEWLASTMGNRPHRKFPDVPKFADLKEITDPIIIFSAGETVGIHMKLRVEHISVDPSYDRKGQEEERGELKITSKSPFSMQIMGLCSPNSFWMLDTNTLFIEHRNAPFEVRNILGANRFNFRNNDLEQNIIEQFIATEKQDQLPENYQYHLGWILLRLLKVGSLEVRERTESMDISFKNPAVGYWKISIDAS